MSLKILITGSTGQLGIALRQTLSNLDIKEDVHIVETAKHNSSKIIAMNLQNKEQCNKVIRTERPAWIINAGAYTNVDGAENNYKEASLINAEAPAHLANELSKYGGKLLHISTDFVFDGNQNRAYKPQDKLNPVNRYGKTKAKGEMNINQLENSYIMRTSWSYGITKKNFLTKIIDSLNKNKHIQVVIDQIGTPTNIDNLAFACWQFIKTEESNEIEREENRILHFSDLGVASKYDFAVKIRKLAIKKGLVCQSTSIRPVYTKELANKTLAKRPKFSCLDSLKTYGLLRLENIHWEDALERVIFDINQ